MNWIILISSHLIGDYVFQNDFLAKFKGGNLFILSVHSWLWSMCVMLGLVIIGKEVTSLDFICLFLGHSLIDYLKCLAGECTQDKSKLLTSYLYIDQLLHIVQIAIIYYI